MRILVTGGAGFIGSHIVDLLVKKQHDVMIMDDLSTGCEEWIHDAIIKGGKKVNFDMCRIQNWQHIDPLIKGFRPEVICHLAAQPAISTSWSDPILNAEVNELGMLNLILSAKDHGVKRIIFASTSAVYKETNSSMCEDASKEPKNPYGISKLAAETYLQSMFPSSVVLRLGNVYGPRQMPIGENQVIPRILRHFLYGDDFAIHGDGEQKRDFVFVEDVVAAFLLSIWGKPGVYNIASGTRTSVNQLAAMIENNYDAHGYKWSHTTTPDVRRDVILPFDHAYNDLGWKPRHALEDGLEATCQWWNDRKQKGD